MFSNCHLACVKISRQGSISFGGDKGILKRFIGLTGNSKKIHWVNGNLLCSSKSIGGISFKDIQKFINALLAKQVWQLFHNKETLLYRVFNAKYFPTRNIL